MNNHIDFGAIERRIRLSKAYSDWVQRNQSSSCLCCDAIERLECHHVVELGTIVYRLWKIYGPDPEKIYEHVIALHQNDKCDSVTMCSSCHNKRHPGRGIPRAKTIYPDHWTTYPRNFNPNLHQSVSHKPRGHLGLIGFQTLFGIGWYILNGHLECRMITFKRSQFAEMLGKQPSSSFNLSLVKALKDLKVAGVLNAYHISGNKVELHLSEDYLDLLGRNPWFMQFDNIQTSKPCVLALKWFLGFQTQKTVYRISLDKLVKHIGINTTAPQMATKAIRLACKHISWASVEIIKGNCTFTLKKRKSIPIFSLRDCVVDAILKGK